MNSAGIRSIVVKKGSREVVVGQTLSKSFKVDMADFNAKLSI